MGTIASRDRRREASIAAGGTIGEIAVTGAASVGIIIAGGAAVVFTVKSGLDDMIAAQDKYNEAIDTHKPMQGKFDALDREAAEAREDEEDCSLKPGEDILSRFIDHTRLTAGFLPKHEGIALGHTIEKHVRKNPDYLRQRLLGEGLDDASTFFDQVIAESVIRDAASNQRGKIAAWFASTRVQHTVKYTGDYRVPIGNSISAQDRDTLLPKYDAEIRLRRTGKCEIYILTAFPE